MYLHMPLERRMYLLYVVAAGLEGLGDIVIGTYVVVGAGSL